MYVFMVCLLVFGFSRKTYFVAWYKQINNSFASPSSNDIQINPKAATNTSLLATTEKHDGNTVQADKYPILIIRDMLVNKDFEKLNTLLEDFQKAYEQDVANEDNMLDAYDRGFFFKESGYETLLDEWVKNFPDHYQPYLARASYYYRMGWDARGGKFSSETSDNQIENMKDYFAKAKEDIKNVLDKKQDNIIPYYFLINIYKALGDGISVKAILQKALEKCPSSFRIRSTYLLAIAPRWGGTYEEMERFIAESQQYISKNQRIGLLQGYIDYEMGFMQRTSKNYGEALELLDKAIEFGSLDLFYDERARIYNKLDRNDEALADINAAIDMRPQYSELYYRRASAKGIKNMLQEAFNDIEIAERLNPNNEDIIKLKIWLADKYHTRARESVNQKDFNSASSDLETAIELDPSNIDYYRLMDWILAKQSNWEAIIIFWNKYLNLNPNDDMAYLERGGAYFHKGDLAAAVADAKRAADLGNADGQKVYDRYKGQVTN